MTIELFLHLMNKISNIVIFASGAGSNATNIVEYFKNNSAVVVSGICTNNPKSGVLALANQNGIKHLVFTKNDLQKDVIVDEFLNETSPDLIVLAGFLLKFPQRILKNFHNRVINLHPSLLPKYGGKGMYGIRVHEAVVEAQETLSGITIHYVNENYDDGAIIAQFSCQIQAGDNPVHLQKKIKTLEGLYFPSTVEAVISKINTKP